MVVKQTRFYQPLIDEECPKSVSRSNNSLALSCTHEKANCRAELQSYIQFVRERAPRTTEAEEVHTSTVYPPSDRRSSHKA